MMITISSVYKIMDQLSYKVLNRRMKKLGFDFCNNFDKGIDETINLLRNSNGV